LFYLFGLIACLIMFGSPAAYGIISSWFKHKEHMQDKRNEELRLQIQLAQTRNEYSETHGMSHVSDPVPRDASWDDQTQAPYAMGYQEIAQPQQ
jgi:hypothetical protein